MNIYAKVSALQATIQVKKTKYNSFGKYYFRNAETILETLRPYLTELGLMCQMWDDIVQMGDRYYVQSTVRLIDTEDENGTYVESKAFAREASSQSGMSDPMLTGSSSSYARKYALGALLLLNDGDEDPDSDSMHTEPTKPETTPAPTPAPTPSTKKERQITQNQISFITSLVGKAEITMGELLSIYELDDIRDATTAQANAMINELKNAAK